MVSNNIKIIPVITIYSVALALLWVSTTSSIMAAEYQSHESIMDTARQHILDQSGEYASPPEVIAGHLDSRLRLKQCDKPLESYTPQGKKQTGKITVGVRCNGANPWSLFVPVSVKVMAEVVVSKRSMPRGSVIGPGDITMEKRDISRLHRGYLEETSAAVGKKLRQRVRRHQVLTPHQLDKPLTVKRNTRVIIQASKESIQVRMMGKALQNGSLGQIIRVRNESSNREIDARVIAPGIVEVPM